MEDEMNMLGSKSESESSILLFSDEEDEIEQLLQGTSRKTVQNVTEQVDSAISIHSSEGDHVPGTVQNESQLDVLSYQPVHPTSFACSSQNGRNAVELPEQDSSDSLGSLFETQHPSTPVRKSKRQFPTTSAIRNRIAEVTESSSDSDGALGHPNFMQVGGVKRRRRRRKRSKINSVYKKTGRPKGRPRSSTTATERMKRLRERGLQFPFVHKEYGKKHLPFKMILKYEQAVLCGLFTYMKELKCRKVLSESLRKLNVGGPERDDRPVRQHKYLDEKRPISPTPESSDETCIEDCDNEDTFDVKIVDNSCFIMENKSEKKKKCLQKKNSSHTYKGKGVTNAKKNSSHKDKGKCITNAKTIDNVKNKRGTIQLEDPDNAKSSAI